MTRLRSSSSAAITRYITRNRTIATRMRTTLRPSPSSLRGQRRRPGREQDREDHRDPEDHGEHAGQDLAVAARLGRILGHRRVHADVAQVLPAQDVLDQAEEHAHRGGSEPEVPGRGRRNAVVGQEGAEPVALDQEARDDRRGERADVDAHVEDGVAGGATDVLLAVELTDHRADVGLEQAGAEDDQAEAEVEGGVGRDREADVAAHDQRAAEEHRLALAQEPVGDPAAGQAHQVDQRHVDADDGRPVRVAPPDAALLDRRGQEQDQERAHPVVREALPHLGEEQGRQAARMAEEGRVLRLGRARGRDL